MKTLYEADNFTKFARGVVVEEIDNDFILELWSSSTKHPDATFYFSKWSGKSEFMSDDEQIFQWLLFCASSLIFPPHALKVTQYAIENFYRW